MLQSCVEPTVSKQLLEKNIMHMIFIMHLVKILEKIGQILSSINHGFSMIITKIYESYIYTSSKYHFLAIFIFFLEFFFHSFMKISCFLEIRKIILFVNFSQLFLKKELKNTKNLNKIYKEKTVTNQFITNLIIIFVLFFLLNVSYFDKLYKRSQHISQLKHVAKFLKNPKNSPFVPLLSFRLNDNDIIWGVSMRCENESIDQGRSYVDNNINISNCYFSRSLSYSGDGGVIYVNGGSYSMDIKYSMLYNCVCSLQGGAIFFDSPNSCLGIICANRCSCGGMYSYDFAYLRASQVNQVEYLSLSNCSHTIYGSESFRLANGNQSVDNTNISMNNAQEVSGIFIFSPSSLTSSHNTFSNNKVSSHCCIRFYSSSGTISISYANIVHNNGPDYGVIYVNGAGIRKMMYCIFHNNQNTLFCVLSGSLEVSHSFIDHSASFSRSTSVSTSNNNSFTIRITYQLPFFNSLHCNADIPLIDSTPVITSEKSPIKSFEETLRLTFERTIGQTSRETRNETPYRSYAECIFTHQMPNWREISVIFSFAFLYPVIILMIS